jgi:plastocyanin domain-containing protein
MKKIILPLVAIIIIIFIVVIFNKPKEQPPLATQTTSNVTINYDTQTVVITAKGGYSPRNTSARANTPTTLKIQTNSTFDCSSALVIPSLNYRKNLPPSGETTIEIPPQKSGTTIRGLCSMGMFSFNLKFN